MLFSVLYDLVLALLGLLLFPWFLFRRVIYGKYRHSFWLRWGWRFPRISKGDRQLVWVHAVSVGETKAVAQLVTMIKERLGDPIIVVSSITETGHAEAQQSIPQADHYCYLPIDFSWNVRSALARVVPDLVIITETDLWYQFLKYSKWAGARIVLANGKISERTMKRLRWARFFCRRLVRLVDLFCVQVDLYKERFSALGVPEEKLVVTGNIKFDSHYPAWGEEKLASWRKQLGIASGDNVLVIGSTHDPEEKLLLPVLEEVWEQCPQVKVLLAPRHPERFDSVASLLRHKGISSVRYSEIETKKGNEQIILVDVMGLLQQCYQLADVAIVAGSYTPKVGGHNILEPSWYGVPVIFGPHMHAQPELVNLIMQYDAGISVPLEQLADQLMTLFTHPEVRHQFGNHGLELVANIQGATKRTLEAMSRLLRA